MAYITWPKGIGFYGTSVVLVPEESEVGCCSFCGTNYTNPGSISCSFHGEKIHWTFCEKTECVYAKQICYDWLRVGGINDSQALRNDALETAKKRLAAVSRRY